MPGRPLRGNGGLAGSPRWGTCLGRGGRAAAGGGGGGGRAVWTGGPGRPSLPRAGFARPRQAGALLPRFDSLIGEGERSVRLFGSRPSFELYVRPEARRYGYYVLPFLLGEDLVARV